MSFSAVCATTSPYYVRKTTQISTTCTYYREILTVRALQSSRTIEYYVLLSLRTIEKRKDWIFEHRTAVRADGARLDIRAGGFWATRHEVAYFDVRVFNPYAASYLHKPLRQVYRMHEQEKQRAYGERVRRIEHATLTPLVFTCTGGAGPAATQCLKRLGSQLADKHQMAYSQAMGWLRCRLSFALLRSSILCLRGARARVKQNFLLQPAVALAEGGMC